MKRLAISIIVLCLVAVSQGKDMSRPWTFWYWMYGAVSKEGIHADLQAMKDVGLGGCYLMPIRGAAERPEYEGKADALSPNFWHMVDYALQQADSLGLEMGVHVCDGFALAGGPWITPEESMQKIVFCDTIQAGSLQDIIHRKGGLMLPRPQGYDGYYEDIATFAIPLTRPYFQPLPFNFDLQRDFKKHLMAMSSTMTRNDKGVFTASEPAWIAFDMGAERLYTNIKIAANGTNMQAQRMAVEVSDDGVDFRLVKQLVPPRQGWQNYDYHTTFTFPPTKARFWRLSWTPVGTEPGSEDLDAAKWRPRLGLKNATFYSQPQIDNWEGKAGYVWRIAPEADARELPDSICWQQREIARLTLDGDRVTGYTLQGSDNSSYIYRIIRIGHTSTGHTNATAGGAKGLECDKFSPQAVSKQVDSWFGLFKQRPHADVVKFLHVDSWECGSQNWGYQFAQEFKTRRGYDLISWLPVMVGIPIESAAKSDEVLRDVRITINELINEKFFTTVTQKAREYGVSFSSESVAPTMVSDGIEHYKYADIPMGEFWLNSPTHDKPNDMLDAISGAHVYGKNIVQAEGFTELRGVWDETPAMVKPLLDRNFCLGMNRLFFHVNTHNPWLDRRPGMTLDGIGLFFQRDNTLFPEAKGFVDYITRCQELLQKGQPVVDIAVYTGDEMPSRSLTPDRLVPMLPGLFGEERVASEQKRLANVGEPMTESPVGVRHSAGIIDMKDWVNPLHGYQYDSMNKDALLTQPFNYKVLVVPVGCRVSEEVQQRIEELRRQGVVIINQPYDKPVLDVIAPDVLVSEDIGFTHRKTNHEDIYFLSNQQDKERKISASFRKENANGIIILDATTGKGQAATDVKYVDNRTEVTLTLAPYASRFVVLIDEHLPANALQTSLEGVTIPLTITWKTEYLRNGCQETVTLPDDWTTHADARERFYSGAVRYTSTFKYQGKVRKSTAIADRNKDRVMMSLGDVCDIAHVYINGQDCGIAWTPPYEVDITDAVKKGKNIIQIDVMNTWHNALRGADQGKAPYEGIWTNARYRTKGDDLLPAGLMGPIEIRY